MDVIDLICISILLLLAVWYCACIEAEKHFQLQTGIKSSLIINAIGNAEKNIRRYFFKGLSFCLF